MEIVGWLWVNALFFESMIDEKGPLVVDEEVQDNEDAWLVGWLVVNYSFAL